VNIPSEVARHVETSEEFHAPEVAGLNQPLSGSRIAVGAVFHEMRNVCGAIAVVHQNLAHSGLPAGNKDFSALGNLATALERIASVNVRQTTTSATEVDLIVLLDELKIVVTPLLQEGNILTHWIVEPGLPLVWADRPSLMQIFPNLITNNTTWTHLFHRSHYRKCENTENKAMRDGNRMKFDVILFFLVFGAASQLVVDARTARPLCLHCCSLLRRWEWGLAPTRTPARRPEIVR